MKRAGRALDWPFWPPVHFAGNANPPAPVVTEFRTNVLANFIGQVTVSGIQFLMIPQYVRYLGVDAYGLVGFFLTLQAVFQLLDLGLSPTVNRELARYSVQPDSAAEARDFVRTLEIAYCVAGLILGGVLFALAPVIQRHWLTTSLPDDVVIDAIRMMGVLTAAQWPLTFYQGGLLGLGRHRLMNAVRVTMTAVSAGGALLVISRVSATPSALFRWQAAASLLYVGTMAVMLWRRLPAAQHRARIRPELAARIWRFAAGMTGIALTGLVLTQVDKIVLSRFASLEQLGIYAVSSALGSGLYTFISPMFASIFPRLSALVAAHDVAGVRALYRRTWLMAALALIPAAAVLVIFSYDVVRLWTQNPALAASAAPVVALLVTGTALNGLMNVPYALQMAHGWTSVPLRVNIVLALLAVPVAILLVRLYGALGAASVWPAANAIYAALLLPLTHRHFPAEVEGTWFVREVGPIAVVSVTMPWVISQLIPHGQGLASVLVPLAAWGAAVVAAMLVCPAARRELQRFGGWP